jgi:PLP dependent protein
MDREKIERIQRNIDKVTQKIDFTARSVKRDPGEIQLVVVTKMQPVDVIDAAISGGARTFGENYTEEALPKIKAFSKIEGIEWHMIGHIQSRKVRHTCEYFDMVQSLDSLKLAHNLNKVCGDLGRTLQCLLEINLSGEETKHGWQAEVEGSWDNLLSEFSQVLELPQLRIKGLMTLPPLFENPGLVRPYYKKLVRLQTYLILKLPSIEWKELSMGTSADYEVAIEEGATIVRIGQAILGPRPLKI